MQQASSSLMIAWIIATAGAPALAQSPPAAPPTAGPLNLETFYQGVWYEQARTPTRLTRGCEYATTQHGRDEQGRIRVRDACRQGGPEGRERSLSGIGTIRDPGQNAVLNVRYRFGPFRPTREYRVIAVGPSDQWFISAEPEFDKVYVFTRAVAPSLSEVETLIKRARALGYAGNMEILATPGRD
jgi:apolipoprotein D and lipocalin family protein